MNFSKNGAYIFNSKYLVEANFGGRSHILKFNANYTEFISIRKGDFELTSTDIEIGKDFENWLEGKYVVIKTYLEEKKVETLFWFIEVLFERKNLINYESKYLE